MKKVIKVWAPWCKPCRDYAPVFDEFKATAENVEIFEVNVDEDKWYTARIFGIKSIPATIIIDVDTKAFEILIGAQTKEQLIEKLT